MRHVPGAAQTPTATIGPASSASPARNETAARIVLGLAARRLELARLALTLAKAPMVERKG
jgi:hypothetical protein